MNYWLVKFAPFRYSWNDCLKNGKFEIYSVRNFQARNNLQAMKMGDAVLFYHSQEDHRIMGVMKVIQEAHPDPTTSDPRWISVTFEPVETFTNPVLLVEIKQDSELAGIGLIIQPRLAVMCLTIPEFSRIIEMSKSG